MKQLKKHENHFCANNDGECICDCFGEGFEAGRQEMKEEIIEWAEDELKDLQIHYNPIDGYYIIYHNLIKKLKEK